MTASGFAFAAGLGVAESAHARNWEQRADVGVFVSYHFGGPSGGQVGLGVEGRGVYLDNTNYCGAGRQLFSGAVLRVEVVDWTQMRLTIGPVVGAASGMGGYGGELTGGLAIGGQSPGLIGQLGGEVTGLALFNARFGYAVAHDPHVGIGLRVPPLSLNGFCAVGRPLRRGRGEARAPTAGALLAASSGGRDAGKRAAAAVWLRRAQLEWASVPSFCELAEQLEASGAPAQLSWRARAAARDELRHAALSLELAALLGDAPYISLDPAALDRRAAISGGDGLRRLALESWTDGCLGEAAAAELALREAAAAREALAKQAQIIIAADEARHAQLAWDVLEWTLAAGGGIRPCLAGAAALEQLHAADGSAATSSVPTSGAAPAMARHGVLGEDVGTAVRLQVGAQARQRLSSRLRA